MRTDELDYDLPPELVAQHPLARRDASRLLVYERATGAVRHRRFADLPDELGGRYVVVVNDTRVVPARLRLSRPGGGAAEILLVEALGGCEWEALARPSRRLRVGMRLGPVELVENLGEGRWRLRLDGEPEGEAPLPPYIVELLAALDVERVTLHVGLDTFRPVTEALLEEHALHGERYRVDPHAWARIRAAERVCAVGTTTVCVLESVVRRAPLEGRTDIFVTPGFEFRRVDALVTNFHLPRSTLLALVMAFLGVEETRRLYEAAVRERYRFYSFGDAMLVL